MAVSASAGVSGLANDGAIQPAAGRGVRREDGGARSSCVVLAVDVAAEMARQIRGAGGGRGGGKSARAQHTS